MLRIPAAVIRDTMYLDGGYLMWKPGLADETYGSPTQDGIFVKSYFNPINS
jgi:hypothetical protein